LELETTLTSSEPSHVMHVAGSMPRRLTTSIRGLRSCQAMKALPGRWLTEKLSP